MILLELNKIYCLDCMDGFKELKDNSIDCIITDPPYFLPASHYGVTLRLKGAKQFSRNFSDLGIVEHFFKDVFAEFKRVIKPTGIIYIFCDGQSYPLFYFHLYHFCKSVRPLIWDKEASVNGYSWRHQHEMIIFAEMYNRKVIPTGDGDILKGKAVKVEKRVHPTEKPNWLIRRLIEKSTCNGDVVFDPFMGSGSTIIACKQLNRKFIGFEKSSDYFKIAEKRIGEATKGLSNYNTSIPPQPKGRGILEETL